MSPLERKILQWVHDSCQQNKPCDVVGELSPSLEWVERTLLLETLDSLVLRGWLAKGPNASYQATEVGESKLSG